MKNQTEETSTIQRINDVLKEKNMKTPRFQEKLGIQSQHWNNWRKRGVPKKMIFEAAKVLGINPTWLLSGEGPKYPLLSANEDAAHYTVPQVTLRHVPVIGKTELNDILWQNIDYPAKSAHEGYVSYPSKDPNAYALKCVGDQMRPRIKNGEFIVVEPGSATLPGDEVLVKSVEGKIMVKTLLYNREGRVYLQSINETAPPLSVDSENIIAIQFISAIVKSALWQEN